MGTREKILKRAKLKRSLKSSDLTKELGISRQTVADHLKRLVQSGDLIRSGSTRKAVYYLAKEKAPPVEVKIRLVKSIKGLEEHIVFTEVDLRLRLKLKLPPRTYSIAVYAFSEMLNNAIDHSKSQKVEVEAGLSTHEFSFTIRDRGIGAFENLRKKLKLKEEFEGVEQILKGKQTTFPERHSGQGIFFTSRIADFFAIDSHRISLKVDNTLEDVLVSDRRPLSGTQVYFRIRRQTRKSLEKLFKSFANDEFEFDKNQLKVKVYQMGGAISRSQARRLLFGLEKFSRITLDFKGVKEVGQAFVDEVFRVFKSQHPDRTIDYVNASPAIEFMIRRGAVI